MRPRRPEVAPSALLALCVALFTIGLATPCSARQRVSLHVNLMPEKLGGTTTIEFGFDIARIGGGIPSPVTRIDLRYPEDLGIVTSGLGIAACSKERLEADGARGCPSSALMGRGVATAAVDVEGKAIEEHANTTIYMAPISGGNINLVFLVFGYSPLLEELVFPGLLQTARRPYGGSLAISVPLIESFAGGEYASLIRFRSTIGPLGVVYYERDHGKFVPYTPTGIRLPRHCPARGFPFAISVAYLDGTSATTRTSVPCPRS